MCSTNACNFVQCFSMRVRRHFLAFTILHCSIEFGPDGHTQTCASEMSVSDRPPPCRSFLTLNLHLLKNVFTTETDS